MKIGSKDGNQLIQKLIKNTKGRFAKLKNNPLVPKELKKKLNDKKISTIIIKTLAKKVLGNSFEGFFPPGVMFDQGTLVTEGARGDLMPYDEIKAEHFVPALKAVCKHTENKYLDPALKLLKEADPKLTFENSVMPFIRMQEEINKVYLPMANLNSLAKTPDVKEAFEEAKRIYTSFVDKNINLNHKAYELVKKFSKTKAASELSGPEKKYLNDLIADFEREGAALSNEQREEVATINKKLSDLEVEFGNNISKDLIKFVITDEKDLEGLPEKIKAQGLDHANKLRENDPNIPNGAYAFGMEDRPAYDPFMKYSPNGKLRKKLYMAYLQRAPENSKIIEEQFKLKLEKAKILGFKNYAEYALSKQMLKEPSQVHDFLKDLSKNIRDKAQEEYDELSKMKQDLLKDGSITKAEVGESDSGVKIWDQYFLVEKVKEAKYSFDAQSELQPYLELESCKRGMFDIAERLFGVTFKQEDTSKVWHPDVEVYGVYDDKKQLISYLYLDLYKRPQLKHQSAWCMSLQGAGKNADGTRSLPHTALVCNFEKTEAGSKTLLTHRDLETLFHEFGHALHGLLSKTDLSVQSGTKTERDFVELPSQLMEEWANDYDALKLYAKHHVTDKVMPEELFKKLEKSRNFFKSQSYVRLIERGMFDHQFYSRDKDDGRSALDIYKEVCKEYGFFGIPEGANYPNMFDHIFAHPYDSRFYSYQKADVLVAGARKMFKDAGMFNFGVGKRYQEKILELGASKPGLEMYKDFTGKEPDPKEVAYMIGALEDN